jgi:hypothetical protein
MCPQIGILVSSCNFNDSAPYLVSGYYRTSVLIAIACSPSQACAKTGNSLQTPCATGYTSICCGSCANGLQTYFRMCGVSSSYSSSVHHHGDRSCLCVHQLQNHLWPDFFGRQVAYSSTSNVSCLSRHHFQVADFNQEFLFVPVTFGMFCEISFLC